MYREHCLHYALFNHVSQCCGRDLDGWLTGASHFMVKLITFLSLSLLYPDCTKNASHCLFLSLGVGILFPSVHNQNFTYVPTHLSMLTLHIPLHFYMSIIALSLFFFPFHQKLVITSKHLSCLLLSPSYFHFYFPFHWLM